MADYSRPSVEDIKLFGKALDFIVIPTGSIRFIRNRLKNKTKPIKDDVRKYIYTLGTAFEAGKLYAYYKLAKPLIE